MLASIVLTMHASTHTLSATRTRTPMHTLGHTRASASARKIHARSHPNTHALIAARTDDCKQGWMHATTHPRTLAPMLPHTRPTRTRPTPTADARTRKTPPANAENARSPRTPKSSRPGRKSHARRRQNEHPRPLIPRAPARNVTFHEHSKQVSIHDPYLSVGKSGASRDDRLFTLSRLAMKAAEMRSRSRCVPCSASNVLFALSLGSERKTSDCMIQANRVMRGQ